MDGHRLEGERVLSTTRRRCSAGGLALALLVVGVTALLTASSTHRADAACNGAGNPYVIGTLDNNGTLVAQEMVTYPGTTCNGDWYYSGAVLDPVTDGSCAYAYYLEPLQYYALQGTSCTTGAWAVYSYADSIGTNSAYVSVRPSYLGDHWWSTSGY
jgi:hypothetical protein